MNDKFDEIMMYIQALETDMISEGEVKKLEELLLNDQEARKYYLDLMSDSHVMQRHFQNMEGFKIKEVNPQKKKTSTTIMITMSLAASIILAFSYLMNVQEGVVMETDDLPVSIGVVIAHNELNSAQETQFKVNQSVAEQDYRLDEGQLYLELYNGVSLVIEAPAQYSFIEGNEIKIDHGKVAITNPGLVKDFTVDMKGQKFVTQKSKLAIDGHNEDGFEIHFFEGRGKIMSSQGSKSIRKAKAYHLAGLTTAPREIELAPEKFITSQNLFEKKEQDHDDAYRNFLAFEQELLAKPELMLYFDFQYYNAWNRTIYNKKHGTSIEATLIGSHWSQGRWKERNSIQIDSIYDRALFLHKETLSVATLASWIQIDRFPIDQSTIIRNEAVEDGQLHWNITRNKALSLGINIDKKWKNFTSPKNVLKEGDLRKWLHISTVFDAPHQKIQHYINGEKVASIPMDAELPLTFGKMAIGNYSKPNAAQRKPRSFYGHMDELMVFKKALSDLEVQDLYQRGSADSYPFNLTNHDPSLQGQPVVTAP